MKTLPIDQKKEDLARIISKIGKDLSFIELEKKSTKTQKNYPTATLIGLINNQINRDDVIEELFDFFLGLEKLTDASSKEIAKMKEPFIQ